jgi:small subunit ribosomal protein S19
MIYIENSLLKKVKKAIKNQDPKPIKTWSRRSSIIPMMVNLVFHVYNGKKFIPVKVYESMINHKLGEFALTRNFKGHPDKKVK